MEIENISKIICFGETLWDVFPESQKPGGAPLNVAVHLQRFGYTPGMISKIGKDKLGKGLLDFMKNKDISIDFIQEDSEYPTGVVNVEIAESGDASYDIVFPSAWDFIQIPENLNFNEFLLVFGSLASRNSQSKQTLLKLLDTAKLALFDVNFRAPHYSRKLIEELLERSDIIKLNEDEIEIIGSWLNMTDATTERICKKLTDQFNLDQIIVTLGSKGAMVYKDEKLYQHGGFKVEVADTVGSGDSFLASYLAHLIKGLAIGECLEMACATGAYVATQNGAVPDYHIKDLLKIKNSNL